MKHFICFLVFWSGVASSHAVLFYSTADPTYNTSEPTGSRTNSGWQYEGDWYSFLGTAIAPHYFITAKHVGGEVGHPFILDGITYVTTGSFEHPVADLRIWRVRESLPVFPELYARTNELGQSLIVIGRGTQRGDTLNIESRFGHELKGWFYGDSDGLRRWGENRISDLIHDEVLNADFLKANFDANEGSNEATLSGGDSGGAVFIQDNAVWKLAGINYGVDNPFNTNDTGPGFYAAIFDVGGLYMGGETNWTFVAEMPSRRPSAFYATRISSYLDWIQQTLTQPNPDEPPILVSSDSMSGPFSSENGA